MKPPSKLWLALTSILLLATGAVCLARPDVALVSAVWTTGWLLLFSGLASLLFAMDAQSILPNAGTMTLSALLRMFVGVFFLAHDLLVAHALPLLFAFWLVFESICMALQSFSFRKVGASGWWAMLLLGIAGALLGTGAIARPEAAAVSLGLLVGLGVISAGIARLVVLLWLHRLEKAAS